MSRMTADTITPGLRVAAVHELEVTEDDNVFYIPKGHAGRVKSKDRNGLIEVKFPGWRQRIWVDGPELLTPAPATRAKKTV